MRTTFKAGADLTGKIGYAVKATANDREVATQSTAGAVCVGILMNDNIQNYAVGVALEGEICKAKLGGSVDCGAELASKNDGTLATATDGQYVIAKALQDGASGDLIEVEVVGYQKNPAQA